ncbi:hypothetical protein D3C79_738720 [compost metagenome]
MVHPENDCRVHVRIRRMSEQHLARPRAQMAFGIGPRAEHPGAVQYHVHPQRPPGQIGRILLGKQRDEILPHQHAVTRQLHRVAETAVAGIEAGEVHHGLGGRQFVDGDYLDGLVTAALVEGPQHVATDAPVPVDGNLDHGKWVSLATAKEGLWMTHDSRASWKTPLASSAAPKTPALSPREGAMMGVAKRGLKRNGSTV